MSRAAGALAALLLIGCESPQVDGSLGELIDLRYQETRITFNPPLDFTVPLEERLLPTRAVAVRYVTPQGDGENVIWQVTARLGGLDYGVEWAVGTEVDLAEYWGSSQRGQVSRNVLDEPGRTYPPLERGTFLLAHIPTEGQPVRGRFSVTFENGTDFASGRTVFQDFQAVIEQ